MGFVRQWRDIFRLAGQAVTNQREFSVRRVAEARHVRNGLRPGTLRCVLLQSLQGLLSVGCAADRIALVGVDGDGTDLISLAWWRSASKARAHEESLHLPRLNVPTQLFGKSFRIGSGVKGFEFQPGGRLMMTVIVVSNGVVSDDHVRAKLSNLQNHSA